VKKRRLRANQRKNKSSSGRDLFGGWCGVKFLNSDGTVARDTGGRSGGRQNRSQSFGFKLPGKLPTSKICSGQSIGVKRPKKFLQTGHQEKKGGKKWRGRKKNEEKRNRWEPWMCPVGGLTLIPISPSHGQLGIRASGGDFINAR